MLFQYILKSSTCQFSFKIGTNLPDNSLYLFRCPCLSISVSIFQPPILCLCSRLSYSFLYSYFSISISPRLLFYLYPPSHLSRPLCPSSGPPAAAAVYVLLARADSPGFFSRRSEESKFVARLGNKTPPQGEVRVRLTSRNGSDDRAESSTRLRGERASFLLFVSSSSSPYADVIARVDFPGDGNRSRGEPCGLATRRGDV